MAGNVLEWCLDEYNRASPRENPLSGANRVDWVMNNFTGVKTFRVLRGGSWAGSPEAPARSLVAAGLPLRTRAATSGFVV